MKEWFTAAELAAASLPDVPRTERGVQLLAARDSWQKRKRAGRGGGSEFHLSSFPQKAQDALLIAHQPPVTAKPATPDPEAQRAALWEAWDRKPGTLKDRSTERMRICMAVWRLMDHGRGKIKAVAAVAEQEKVSIASILRWLKLAGTVDRHDACAALMPRYVGRTKTAECDVEAWDFFKADYLRREQPCAEACYERLQRAAVTHGWQVPSVATLMRRIRKLDPRFVIYMRQGEEALARTYPAQERDRSIFHAMEAVNADGHKWDVFVKWTDGDVIRPVTVVIQDLYSGKIVGWRTAKTENADSVRLALGDMVENFGIPVKVWLDNGRGFASKWISGGAPTRYRFKVKEEDPAGVLSHLGVKIHWTMPYHGQSKPIERAFRDLCEYVAKHPALAGAYTGNKPDAKPENYGSRAVPLSEFQAILDGEIAAHNARIGRRSAVCGGIHSFDRVFEESYAKAVIRRASASQRALLLLAAEGVTANREDSSVRLYGNRYQLDTPEVAAEAGRKIVVRFDPQRLDKPVYLYRLDGRFLGMAPRVEKSGFETADHGRDYMHQLKRRNKAIKGIEQAEMRMSAIEAAALLPTPTPPAPPATNVVAGVFGGLQQPKPAQAAGMDPKEAEAAMSWSLEQLRQQKKSVLD